MFYPKCFDFFSARAPGSQGFLFSHREFESKFEWIDFRFTKVFSVSVQCHCSVQFSVQFSVFECSASCCVLRVACCVLRVGVCVCWWRSVNPSVVFADFYVSSRTSTRYSLQVESSRVESSWVVELLKLKSSRVAESLSWVVELLSCRSWPLKLKSSFFRRNENLMKTENFNSQESGVSTWALLRKGHGRIANSGHRSPNVLERHSYVATVKRKTHIRIYINTNGVTRQII